MPTANPNATPPRRKIGRGARIVLAFVGLFLVLQIGESLWRRTQPDRPRPGKTAQQAAATMRPSVRVRGDTVIIEYGNNRNRFGLGDEADRRAMEACVREQLELSFGPLDAEGPLPEPAAAYSRREAPERVQQVADRCINEIVDIQIPRIPPVPPLAPTR